MDLDLICFACNKKGHVAKFCSKFHYMPTSKTLNYKGKFIR